MRFAAMGGLAGLDWPSARLLCGASEPWDEIVEMLRFYESGAVAGASARTEQMKLANKTGGADG